MRNTISLIYDGEDILFSFSKAEKVYNQAEFNNQAKYGSLRETLRSDLNLLQFVLFRGAKDNCNVKKYCLEYADNQKKVDMKNGAAQCKIRRSWKARAAEIRRLMSYVTKLKIRPYNF